MADQILKDVPTGELIKWGGYFRNTDPTLLASNVLTFPSINCFIPNGDKIVPRAGKIKLPQTGFTNPDDFPIIGHHKHFLTIFGQDYEIRAWRNGDDEINDVVTEALWCDPDTNQQQWVQFSSAAIGNLAPRLPFQYQYVFDEWFDNIENKGRLVWVNRTDDIYSWSGAISRVRSKSATTITLDRNWGYYGFDGEGFTIGGVSYSITAYNPASDTQTVDGGTASINVGDIVVDETDVQDTDDVLPTGMVFDFCRTIKNHVVYGSFSSRKLWASNAINVDSSAIIVQADAVQNDLIIEDSDQYDLTVPATLRFVISSVVQPPLRQFQPIGDDSDVVVFSGQHTGLNRDIYRVVIVNVGPSFPTEIYRNGALITTTTMSTLVSTPFDAGNGITISALTTNNIQDGDAWSLEIGGQDQYNVYINNSATPDPAGPFDASDSYDYHGVVFEFAEPQGHTLGDNWTVNIEPAVTKGWADFYQSIIRKPGQGFTFNLRSNFWTMDIQEDVMYLNDQRGSWEYLELTLSADLLNESITVQPLKQATASKVISPYLTGHMDNDIVYVTSIKTLDFIGRKELIQLPQIGNLSQPVALDFQEASFNGGAIEYFQRRLFISSPKESVMFCWDNQPDNKYWQPPQVFSANGILSLAQVPVLNSPAGAPAYTGYDERLISHSSLRNQTFVLYMGDDDDGTEFTVRARTSYDSVGERWRIKAASSSFLEGYIAGAPPLVFTVYQNLFGCGGIFPHDVKPVVCQAPDHAPLGEGTLGSHQLGSDQFVAGSYFQAIFKRYSPSLQFYFAALEVECTTKSHTYEILGMGLNAIIANRGNIALIEDSGVVQLGG